MKESQCTQILRALSAGPCTSFELAQICLRYGGRIKELRDRCIHIASVGRGNRWNYHLLTPINKIDFDKARLI